MTSPLARTLYPLLTPQQARTRADMVAIAYADGELANVQRAELALASPRLAGLLRATHAIESELIAYGE